MRPAPAGTSPSRETSERARTSDSPEGDSGSFLPPGNETAHGHAPGAHRPEFVRHAKRVPARAVARPRSGVPDTSWRTHAYPQPVPDFQLVAPFQPTGDQPQAIDSSSTGSSGPAPPDPAGRDRHGQDVHDRQGHRAANRPTLVLAHNKTLAAQLYAEFREFFPDNAVEYFVSYFDYYQPEAYLPRSDTYIEKDSSRNDEIDKLRHAATHALFERRDVIIVASRVVHLRPRRAGRLRRDRRSGCGSAASTGATACCATWSTSSTSATTQALSRARFRVRGDTLELQPAYDDHHRPGRVLRRRGRADHRARPADRRAARRAQGAQRLPGLALRHAGRQARGRDRRHRGGDGGARRRARGRGPGRSRPRGSASGRRSTSR